MKKLTLRQFAAALRQLPEAIPATVQETKAELMASVGGPEALVHRRLTGTLAASEVPFEGAPEDYARDLEYGEGHSPVGDAELEAVLEAAGPWSVVGWVNDAQHLGVAYGLGIELEDRLHLGAHKRLGAVFRQVVPEAWVRAVANVIRRAA